MHPECPPPRRPRARQTTLRIGARSACFLELQNTAMSTTLTRVCVPDNADTVPATKKGHPPNIRHHANAPCLTRLLPKSPHPTPPPGWRNPRRHRSPSPPPRATPRPPPRAPNPRPLRPRRRRRQRPRRRPAGRSRAPGLGRLCRGWCGR